jgi:hypothetical protein
VKIVFRKFIDYYMEHSHKRGREWINKSHLGRLVKYVLTMCYTPKQHSPDEPLDTSPTDWRQPTSLTRGDQPNYSWLNEKYRQRLRIPKETSLDEGDLASRLEDLRRNLQELTGEAPVFKRAKVQVEEVTFEPQDTEDSGDLYPSIELREVKLASPIRSLEETLAHRPQLGKEDTLNRRGGLPRTSFLFSQSKARTAKAAELCVQRPLGEAKSLED